MGWPGRAQRPKTTVEQGGEASKLKELTMHAHQQSSDPVATIGLDIGKNTFHLMGADCIISGIRPQIAQTIVHLGLQLDVVSKATMADAFALALKRTGQVVSNRTDEKPA
jgi:hypothetical protein